MTGWRINATCGSPVCTTRILATFVDALSHAMCDRDENRDRTATAAGCPAVTLCIDAGDPLCTWENRSSSAYGECGYLDLGALPSYVAAGVGRLQHMGTYPLKGPLTLARERLQVDRIAATVGGDDVLRARVGIGLQYYALNSTRTWSEAALRAFLAWLAARGVSEVDMFCANWATHGAMPAFWWSALEDFVVDAPS